MRTATLGVLAALSLTFVLALPPASADLVPEEAMVDQLVTDSAQQAADTAHHAGDIADGAAANGLALADMQVGIVRSAADGAGQAVDGGMRDTTARAGNVVAFALGTASDGTLLVQQLDEQSTQHVLDALHAAAGLATRSLDRAVALDTGLLAPVTPTVLATYDAVPKPLAPLQSDITIDVTALFHEVSVDHVLVLIANGPDVAALQQAVLDYAAAAAAAPGGILAPASDYAVLVVGQGGSFVGQTEGDTVGTGLVVIELLSQ